MSSVKISPSGTFKASYSVGDQLGEGAFAVVYECIDKKTKEHYAVKVINKRQASPQTMEALDTELEIMRKLQHKYIIFLHDVVASELALYMVIELVRGGDLFHVISHLKHYSEAVAAQLMQNFLSGLEYIHQCGVVHRDLKPENLLMVNHLSKLQGDDSESQVLAQVKIADFGLASFCDDTETLTQCCGTPFYIAPEVLEVGLYRTGSAYGKSVDLWSAGVIVYILLSGTLPFSAHKRDKMFRLIVRGKYNMEGPMWESLSAEAKDFVAQLLEKDPKRRLTATTAQQHAWLAGHPLDQHLPTLQHRISSITARTKLRAAVFGVEAASRLQYLAICRKIDVKPNSGILSELEDREGHEEIDVLDLSKNYVGPKGLSAVLDLVATKPKLKKLVLASNEIENTDVAKIVATLERHPSVTHIDLSHNPLSRVAARKLQYLIQQNPCIQRVDLENTDICAERQAHIAEALRQNKLRFAAAKAKVENCQSPKGTTGRLHTSFTDALKDAGTYGASLPTSITDSSK